MDRGVGAAAGLPGSDRKDLAIQALAGSETVSDLAAQHGVSRKFVYQLRSRYAERQGKSPRELMTGRGHPHWLTLLGLGPLQPQRA